MATEKGLSPGYPVIAAYYQWDSKEGGNARFTSGPIVAEGVPEAEGDGFGVRTVAGCRCATVVHVGSLSELEKAYDAVFDWMEAKGFENRLPYVEIHRQDPNSTKPSKLTIKICVPIAPAART